MVVRAVINKLLGGSEWALQEFFWGFLESSLDGFQ